MGLFDAFSADQNTGIANKMAGQQESAINKGAKKADKKIEFGLRKGVPVLEQGAASFQPFQASGVQGNAMLANSLGLNGQAGNDAALGAFQNGPGFTAALDRANQNILRNNAATGNVLSGNTGIALSDRARDMQNLEYGGWQDRLAGLSQQGLQGAGGMSQNLQQLAGLWQTGAQDQANIALGRGTNLANIYGQQGQNIAGANNTANSNQWGAILGLANAAASAAGGKMG
jgi:hypothetical protein